MAASNNPFDVFPYSPSGPMAHGTAITKSDTTVYSPPLRAIWVGGTGNIKVTMAGDDDAQAVTLQNVPVGMLTLAVSKVWDATTATLLIGFW